MIKPVPTVSPQTDEIVVEAPKPEQVIEILPLEARVRTEAQLERQYGRSVEELCTDHEQLIE